MAYSAACNPAAGHLQPCQQLGRQGRLGRLSPGAHSGSPCTSTSTSRASCGKQQDKQTGQQLCNTGERLHSTAQLHAGVQGSRDSKPRTQTPTCAPMQKPISDAMRSRYSSVLQREQRRAAVRCAYLPEEGAGQCNRGSDGAEVALASARLPPPDAPPLAGQTMPRAQHVAAVDPRNMLACIPPSPT